MHIGFDLDKVFIDSPPFIPDKYIERMYRDTSARKLTYRMPSKQEQLLRRLSHYEIFRPALKHNIATLKKYQRKKKNNRYYLISSRFSFLKHRTTIILKAYGIDTLFDEIHFNYNNLQPHEFKDMMLKKCKIDKYIDDDSALLEYLATRHKHTKFYWLNTHKHGKLGKNLFAITSIKDALV